MNDASASNPEGRIAINSRRNSTDASHSSIADVGDLAFGRDLRTKKANGKGKKNPCHAKEGLAI